MFPFSPNRVCTRAQVVTFLWRAAGQPEPKSTACAFTDVKKNAFYYKAMLWAVENGITAGTSGTTFSPNKTATRGQVVTFLHRFAGEPEPELTDCSFTDVKTTAFYYKAMLWAVEQGITNGTSDTTFGPGRDCTRGHVVTFLCRLLAETEEKPMIHASFTGFVGDWTAAPILEGHDWREIVDLEAWLRANSPEDSDKTYAALGWTYLDLADFEVNTDVNRAYAANGTLASLGFLNGCWAGDNPFADQPFREDRIVISPKTRLNSICAMPMQLRNARRVVMTAADAETGALYAAVEAEYVPKAVYDRDYAEWISPMGFLFDGIDSEGNLLPGGTKVTLRFYADLAYGEDPLGAILGEEPETADYERLAAEAEDWLVWSFPVTVDDAAPVFSDAAYDPAGQTLTVTVTDDQYLAAAALFRVLDDPEEGTGDYEQLVFVSCAEDEPGAPVQLVFEDVGPGAYVLSAADYADNEGYARFVLGDSGELCSVTFTCPAGWASEEFCDVCLVSRGEALQLPLLTGDREHSFLGWLREPLEGIVKYSDLEQSGFLEGVLSTEEPVPVTEDLALSPIFRFVSQWSEAEEMISDSWEMRNDFCGTWALGGGPGPEPDQGRFLNADGAAATETTVVDGSVTYLLLPDRSILFSFQPDDGPDWYRIQSLETGKYLVIEDGAPAFLDEDRACSWHVRWVEEDRTAWILTDMGWNYLVYDDSLGAFLLTEEPDFSVQRLLLFGSFPLEYSCCSDPALWEPAG